MHSRQRINKRTNLINAINKWISICNHVEYLWIYAMSEWMNQTIKIIINKSMNQQPGMNQQMNEWIIMNKSINQKWKWINQWTN
jgi:hypothetical protein